ncbi:hypothetical protein [Nonomuraea dietziae]|uniref:hypothetical protein n=1 Tax=Nonomuraea dietziae TaxID=65515 RepID=UPI0031D619A7
MTKVPLARAVLRADEELQRSFSHRKALWDAGDAVTELADVPGELTVYARCYRTRTVSSHHQDAAQDSCATPGDAFWGRNWSAYIKEETVKRLTDQILPDVRRRDV